MLQDITRLISSITVVQLLLFAFFLLNHRKGKRTSGITLAAFLFSNALFILNFIIAVYRNILPDIVIHLYLAGYSLVFLFGPLLYFYTRTLTEKNFHYIKKDLIHFIPFLIISVYILITFGTQPAAAKRELINSGIALPVVVSYILTLLMNLQIFTYLVISLVILKGYRSEIKKYLSSIDNLNLHWLSIVIFGFALMWFVDLIHFFIQPLSPDRLIMQVLTFISLLTNFIFANLIIYKGLQHPEIYSGIEEKNDTVKYEKSSLSAVEKERLLGELLYLMENNKPYLNPSLTIKEVALKLNAPVRHLSQIINESLNKNFYDFVNGYRIEEAKKMLKDKAGGRKTILEILYEVGFNSKSSFNTAFSKCTGTTPSEFKKL